MNDLIEKALSIIDSFDWYWQMEDSGYSKNLKNAEYQKNQFRKILGQIDNAKISMMLRDLWIANYELSRPYMQNAYYEERKKKLEQIEDKLKELTETFITI